MNINHHFSLSVMHHHHHSSLVNSNFNVCLFAISSFKFNYWSSLVVHWHLFIAEGYFIDSFIICYFILDFPVHLTFMKVDFLKNKHCPSIWAFPSRDLLIFKDIKYWYLLVVASGQDKDTYLVVVNGPYHTFMILNFIGVNSLITTTKEAIISSIT